MPKKGLQKVAVKPLTQNEMEQVTVVFHQYESGVREGTIHTKHLHVALKSIGINPTEQEISDMVNEVDRKGSVYFKDFCKLVLRKYREYDEAEFRKNLFKILCGTDPLPTQFRAKKYKLHERFLQKADFIHMMKLLPVPVDDKDIEEMFLFADKDGDGKISWKEFQIMINPPPPPKPPTPHVEELHILAQNPDKSKLSSLQPQKDSPETAKVDQEDKTKEKAGKDTSTSAITTSSATPAVTSLSSTAATTTTTTTTTLITCGEKTTQQQQQHRKHCAICQSKVVKPIVETEISIAAGKFAKDSTLVSYSWRNEKASFKEKEIAINTKVQEKNEADPLFVDHINVKEAKTYHPPQQPEPVKL